LQKRKVLIVEDSESFANILEEMLNDEADFEVVGIANDGLSALEDIKNKKPDIMVLDIIMPKLDGLGVLEHVNKMAKEGQLEKRPNILVLSAVGQDNIAKNCISLGADYCMLKPFDLSSFLARLRSFYGPRGNPSRNEKISDLTLKVSAMLQSIGCPLHIKGFKYINDAIISIHSRTESNNKIMSTVYSIIAEKYDTTPASVEKAIRSAIEVMFTRNFFDDEHPVLGDLIAKKNKKVTNSEFIMIMVEWLKREI
jgi:two-component system, response regulator, stage 0 sporulation protein A